MKKQLILTFSLFFAAVLVFGQTGNYQMLNLNNSGNGSALLSFQTERPWMFKQVGSGASSSLQLHNFSGPNKHFQIKTDGGLHLLNQADNYNTYLSASGGNSYLGALGGNIGIGTNSPQTNLEVLGGGPHFNAYDANSFVIRSSIAPSTNDNRMLGMTITLDGSSNVHASHQKSVGIFAQSAGAWSNNVDMLFHTRGTNQSPYFTEKMRIRSNGYVGIGTSSPKYPFDIKTYNSYEGNNLYFGDRRIYIAGVTGTGSQMYGGMVLRNMGSGIRSLDFVVGNNDFSSNKTPENIIMNIKSNGKIGIGTDDTGSHKLAVEGSIGAREIKVEASGWSDFVFEKDYELRTLEEVENHIEENGHLPEIPSEAEVTENGINLGEMNAKLLQKIEELTLYLIEQNKELKNAQSEIIELKEKVSQLQTD